MFTICHLLCIFQKDYWKFCVTVTGVLLTLALLADQVMQESFSGPSSRMSTLTSLTLSQAAPIPHCTPWQNDKLHCTALTLQEALGP